MTKKMLIDASHAEETRVVVLDGNQLEDFDVETTTRKQIKGNIYLAKVIRVEPSLQAAFVEYGGNRHGFLAFGEIHPDYYQIPIADRQRLLVLAAQDEGAADTPEAPATEDETSALADMIAPEPEVVEVRLEREAGPEDEPYAEDEPKTYAARPLEIIPVEIVSAPPFAQDETGLVEETVLDAEAPEPFTPPAGEEDHAFEEPAQAADSAEHGAPPEAAGSEQDTEAEEQPEYSALLPAPESLGGDGDDAAEARERRQRQRFLRHYKIQEVIHRRQIMLVQVVKEERGNKGAALTTYLSLAGRFSVLMPNSPTGGGVSRKITSPADRRRLKEVVAELDIPEGMGLIVRTAGANQPKPEIKRDCEYLLRLWDDIRDRTLRSIAPALIYEEASLIKRAIRDVYTRDVEDIYVDGEEGFRAARDFMRMLMPTHARKVRPWSEGQPLFAKYQVEAQLDALLNPVVQLRSGGYIVINQTEALVSIDVNSGRSTRERNIEDTALRTNLEAADEVARQLRMRDLAGLIVIDFIDMESRRNIAAVERRLKDTLKNDRARIQIGSISHFGLMEMSRQRLRPSLTEAALIACPHCNGMGHVRSPESAALHVLRAIEDEGAKFRSAEILVTLLPEIALYLFNHKRDRLTMIENRYAMRVIFIGDASLTAANFRIEKTKAHTAKPMPQTRPAAAPPTVEAREEAEEGEEFRETEAAQAGLAGESEAGDEEDEPRRRRRRRRRGRRGDAAGTVEETMAGPDQEKQGDEPGYVGPMAEAAREEHPGPEGSVPDQGLSGSEPAEQDASESNGEEKLPRRRRSRGGRRRSGTAPARTDELPGTPEEIVYPDIADIFEAAERAEEVQRVKAHLVVAVEPEAELPAQVHVPEEVLEPMTHTIFQPATPQPATPEPAALEPATLESATPEPVKPIVVGTDQKPVEKRRGWWRSAGLRH